jgi:hypothetical protein
MTLIEVLVTIFVLILLAALLLPALARTNRRSPETLCISNLKQVGLAFRLWANDHGDKYPWQVSTAQFGSLELVPSGRAFPHFQAISNELNVPKVLACAADKSRTKAVSWDEIASPKYLSYFVGLDAAETHPQSILSGDRTISPTGQLVSGILSWPDNTPIRWAPGSHVGLGNVALSDGSAQGITDGSSSLQGKKDSGAAVRLVMP